MNEEGAAPALSHAARNVPVVPDVAAAIRQHGLAAVHEMLMTPRSRRLEGTRESRRTALQGRFDDGRGAGPAPAQAASREAGTHDVAAALGQPGRAAVGTQEVLTTPHVRRSVYGRESHGAVPEGLLEGQGDVAPAKEQPFSPVPREVLTFSDVRGSVGAEEGYRCDERRTQTQGQGPSSLLVDLSPPRTGLGDPLRPDRVPLAFQGLGSRDVRVSDDLATSAAPSLRTQTDETGREGYDGLFGPHDPHSLGRGPASAGESTVQQQDG